MILSYLSIKVNKNTNKNFVLYEEKNKNHRYDHKIVIRCIFNILLESIEIHK